MLYIKDSKKNNNNNNNNAEARVKSSNPCLVLH